jgi:hypothetical protein
LQRLSRIRCWQRPLSANLNVTFPSRALLMYARPISSRRPASIQRSKSASSSSTFASWQHAAHARQSSSIERVDPSCTLSRSHQSSTEPA